jgi:hypothetical protein
MGEGVSSCRNGPVLGVAPASQSLGLAWIRNFGPTDAFSPEAIKVLSRAYDMAIESLHDVGQPEVVREGIATRIIEAARRGHDDPAALCAAALSAFNTDKLAR